jgi:ribosomal protein L37E
MMLEQWSYAVCRRCGDRLRVVSEDECGHCACWESPTDGARDVDYARNHFGARGSAFRV